MKCFCSFAFPPVTNWMLKSLSPPHPRFLILSYVSSQLNWNHERLGFWCNATLRWKTSAVSHQRKHCCISKTRPRRGKGTAGCAQQRSTLKFKLPQTQSAARPQDMLKQTQTSEIGLQLPQDALPTSWSSTRDDLLQKTHGATKRKHLSGCSCDHFCFKRWVLLF